MAFVFEGDRTYTITNKETTPGPGQYISHKDYKYNKGYAPFLSTAEKGGNKKITKDSQPGPGSYEPTLFIGNSLKNKGTFHSTLVPEKETIQSSSFSNVFKSKTKRFEYKIDSEVPGPGQYNNDPAFKKSASTTAMQSQGTSAFPIHKLTKENKTIVPSIPSYTHSYGYTENEGIIFNVNPINNC